jgi:hypothetical protein
LHPAVRGEIDRLCDRRIADGIFSTPLIGDQYFSGLGQILAIDVRFGFAMINRGRAKRRIVMSPRAVLTFKGVPSSVAETLSR